MRKTAVLTAVFTVALVGWTLSRGIARETPPATQPSAPAVPAGSVGKLEQRAAAALATNDFATALPLLRSMATLYRDEPRRLKAINEQIAAAEKALAEGKGVNPTPAAPEERKPIPAPKEGETVEFQTIKDLGNFEYDAEKGGGIPTDVKALSGKPIRIRGFMIPMDQADNITTFALVPSLFSCCFGAPPQIQHTLVVHVPKGKAVSYYPDEIIIEGKLRVDEKKEDGFIVSVFELSASSVKPVSN